MLNPTAALLAIASANFASLVQFYYQLLNQEPVVFIANTYAEFQLPGVRFGIFRPKSQAPLPSAAPGSDFASVQCPCAMSLCLEVDHLELAIAHLTALGYPPTGEILTASHGREIYAYDPDGNGLILHESTQITPVAKPGVAGSDRSLE